MAPKEERTLLEKRSNLLWNALVPTSGMCPTREGEMLRAMTKISYRMYNDGDHFDRNYGITTAGPAHAYLVSSDTPIRNKLKEVFKRAEGTSDDEYTKVLEEAQEIVVQYIESLKGRYTENKTDMYEYDALFEAEDNNWYDDEEEDEEEDE